MNAIDYDIGETNGGHRADTETVVAGEVDNLRPLPRISIHAFCISDTVHRTMSSARATGAWPGSACASRTATLPQRPTCSRRRPTPNLIILETDAGPRDLMAELAPLAEVCDPSSRVILVGRHNDIALYRELIRNGISEYIVAPFTMADMMGSIASIFVDPEAEPLGRTIAFIGAKGGVGSSTIAHNCAFGISSLFSTETVLADLDLPFERPIIDFDQDPAQGMAEAVFSPERLDEVFLDRLLTKCGQNLSLLAAPSMLDRGYDYERGAFQPILDVLQRTAPITVLDLPHTWADWTRAVLSDVDDIFITCAPDLANLRNMKNMIDALKKLRPQDKPPHLILNQVGMPKRPEIAPSDFFEPLELEPVAIIPFDAQLFGTAANSGRMISEMDGKSPTAETFSQLAHLVTGRATIKKPKKAGLGSFIEKLRKK